MDSMDHKDKKPIKFVERQDPDHPYCTNWPMSEEEENNKDFIGIFPNAASKEYCEKVITRFEYIQESQSAWGSTGRGKIWSRQEGEGISTILKDDDTYFLGDTNAEYSPLDEEVLLSDMPLLKEFSELSFNCYNLYAEKYGALSAVSPHKMSTSVKIQKTKPSQGYHVWHCDADNFNTSRRMLVVTLYLNTVEEGGETEFLYQSMRIPPVQGTLSLSPAAWTHTHRGNPPLKGNKYIITTWLEFTE